MASLTKLVNDFEDTFRNRIHRFLEQVSQGVDPEQIEAAMAGGNDDARLPRAGAAGAAFRDRAPPRSPGAISIEEIGIDAGCPLAYHWLRPHGSPEDTNEPAFAPIAAGRRPESDRRRSRSHWYRKRRNDQGHAQEETMKQTLSLLAAAIVGASASLNAAAQEVTLKVHHWGSPKSPQHVSMLVPWCEKVAKDSNNRIKCDVFPSMQLGGSPPQLYDQAKDGVVDVIFTIPGYTAGRFPLIEAFELPFMATTPEATSRAAWEFGENSSIGALHAPAGAMRAPGQQAQRARRQKQILDRCGTILQQIR